MMSKITTTISLLALLVIGAGCNKNKNEEPTLQLKGNFSYQSVVALEGFWQKQTAILANKGVTTEEFMHLSTVAADGLTDAERTKLKSVREAVDKPTNSTLLQKVISLNDIYTYMQNVYGGTVGGYVCAAADTKGLNNQYNIYWGLRLDYKDTKFSPTGAGYAVIRFYSPLADKLTIPYCAAMGGTTINEWPWTGGGFTSSKLGLGGYPEYTFTTYSAPTAGAELYEVTPNGTEILRSRFVDNAWQTNETMISKATSAPQPIRNGVFADTKAGQVVVTTVATYKGREFIVRGLVGDQYHLTTTDYLAARGMGLEAVEKGIYGAKVDRGEVSDLHERIEKL